MMGGRPTPNLMPKKKAPLKATFNVRPAPKPIPPLHLQTEVILNQHIHLLDILSATK